MGSDRPFIILETVVCGSWNSSTFSILLVSAVKEKPKKKTYRVMPVCLLVISDHSNALIPGKSVCVCVCFPPGDSVVHSSQRWPPSSWGRWEQGEEDGRHSCVGPGVPQSGPGHLVWTHSGKYTSTLLNLHCINSHLIIAKLTLILATVSTCHPRDWPEL